MKKTFLLTVLILSLVFSVTSHAAYEELLANKAPSETEKDNSFLDPAVYLPSINGKPAGTLPNNNSLGDRMANAAHDYVNKGTRFITAAAEGGSSAKAVTDGTDAVFRLTGDVKLIDKASIAVTDAGNSTDSDKIPAPVRRYSAKVKLSSVNAGTTGVHVIGLANNTNVYEPTNTGVYLSNSGAYVYNVTEVDSDGNPEKVWFVPENTMSDDTWYTVETVVEILATGYVAQDAAIYDETGNVVGERSGYCYVDNNSGITASITKSQIFTDGIGTGEDDYAMVKEWKGYSSTSAFTKTTFTPDGSDVDEITDNRKVYKLISSIALDGDSVNTDTVKLTSETVDMTGKYTVTYDPATQAIVVEATNAFPYGTTFTVELDKGRMLSNSEKYPAVDYTNASALSYSFTTPADPFVVSSIVYTPGTGASVVVSSNDSAPRSCIVIVSSFGADGEYIETKCGSAVNITAGATPTINVPAVTERVGGHVQVMVWDNWLNMNWFEDLYTLPI